MSEQSDARWANIGRILTGLAAVATISFVFHHFFIANNGPDVNLKGAFHPYATAPTWRNAVATANRAIESENLERMLAEISATEADSRPLLAGALSRKLQDSIPGSYADPWLTINWLNNIFVGTITNDGERIANNVRITIPSASMAVLEWDQDRVTQTNLSGSLSVGSLQPEETVRVRVWTRREMEEYHLEDVQVVYDEGIGDVNLGRTISGLSLTIIDIVERLGVGFLVIIFFSLIYFAGRSMVELGQDIIQEIVGDSSDDS